MFKLVRFLGDNFHYVYSNKDVQHNRNGNSAKWRNKLYAVKVIASSDNEIILKSLCFNINNCVPFISLCGISLCKDNSSPSKIVERVDLSLCNQDISIQPWDIFTQDIDIVTSPFRHIDTGMEETLTDNLEANQDTNWLQNWYYVDLPIDFQTEPIELTDANSKNSNNPVLYTNIEHIQPSPCGITIDEEVFNLPKETNDINENEFCMREVETNEHGSSCDVFRIDNHLDVSESKNGKKKYYCNYCSRTVTNFGRHLVTLHKKQPEVSCILKYPKGHPERKKMIASIRNAAQHIFNVNPDVNTGKIIVSRRPSKNKHRDATHYRACPNCKQLFSKLSLRVHFNKCSKEKQDARGVLLKSKQFQMFVHKNASERLVKFVLAHCREDEVAQEIMFDDLCIKFGNKLCKHYRGQQHSNMIRTRLRELGKFKMEVKKMDGSVQNLSDILVPGNYEKIVIAINKVAGFDETSGIYRAPSTAYNLGLHIKTVTTLLRSEYIKEGNSEKRTEANDLLCLMNEGFQTDINKMVNENQSQNKRHKKVLLPTAADINALKFFLKKGMKEEYDSLKAHFTREAWKNLAGYTLICLQLFNRKRAGELERILIEDYRNYEFLDVDDDLFKNLDEKMKNLGQNYARFFIRGKLNRKVSVLISREHIDCIELILEYREEYGVSPNNRYVFGTVGKQCFLRACHLMRYYSLRCGAPNPNRLRGTELRKQIATACKMYNLPDLLVEDVANHLGHDISIHKSIYRQSLGTEVPVIANILLKAMGGNLGHSDDDECTNDGNIFSDNNICEKSLIAPNCSFTTPKIPQEYPLPTPSCSFEIKKSQQESSILSPHCTSSTKNLEKNNNITTDIVDKQKRTSWTTPEINAVEEGFGEHINIGIVPTFEECHEVRSKYTCLKNRTPPQIKSFVINQTKKLHNTPSLKVKKTWKESEKMVVKKEFSLFLKEKRLPSLPLCSKVIAANPILNERTPILLKAFINNMNKKALLNDA